MADNVAITPGVGATIATDDVGGVQFQRVKLDIGGDGVSSPVTSIATETTLAALNTKVTAVNTGAVTIGTALPAGANIIGAVTQSGTWTVTANAGSGTFAVSGPLTDTQLRATPVPVSLTSTTITGTVTANAGTGTFAVSAASLPLPSGAATETTLAAIGTKTPSLGQATMAASSPVVIASNQSSLPVTIGNASIAVTGAFFQATQPVSGTVTANAGTGTFTVANGGTFAVQAAQSGTWTVNAPTITKGTQGSTGFATQDLKDSGRVIVNAATAIAGVTAVTTEALLALNISRDGAATASATSHAVTSGKRWRVTGMVASVRSTSAAVLSGRVSLRMNPSGAVTATSPIIAIASMTQQAAALAEGGDTCAIMFPDGIEFSGTMQIGLSQVCSAATGVVYASLIGYEY